MADDFVGLRRLRRPHTPFRMNPPPLYSPRCLLRLVAVALLFTLGASLATARTLRLFVVGNSFSNNATRFLPELARAGGHELIMGKAQTGGCSFERHWNAVEAFLADPADAKAKIYGGKTLQDQIGTAPWDIITMQQYSLHSSDVETYRPSAAKLHAHLLKLRPQAEIVLHQTWAYRSDANKFGQTGPGTFAASQSEMWERSRAAYWQVAGELRIRVIPSGNAFWRIDSDPKWGYRPDLNFDFKNARPPALPDQTHSLHVGYRWNPEQKLGKDANHASVAGEYLGALVWYAVLFGESPEKLAFAPPGLAPDFAAHLRKVAAQTVHGSATENKKLHSAR